MAKEVINIDKMKLSDGKKAEECTDEELNEAGGGFCSIFAPQIPWTCPCGHYNDTTERDSFSSTAIDSYRIVRKCVKCGQSRC